MDVGRSKLFRFELKDQKRDTYLMLCVSGDECHIIVASVQVRRDLISSTVVIDGSVGIDVNRGFDVAITLKFIAEKILNFSSKLLFNDK